MTEVKILSLSPFALRKLCNRSFLFYSESWSKPPHLQQSPQKEA